MGQIDTCMALFSNFCKFVVTNAGNIINHGLFPHYYTEVKYSSNYENLIRVEIIREYTIITRKLRLRVRAQLPIKYKQAYTDHDVSSENPSRRKAVARNVQVLIVVFRYSWTVALNPQLPAWWHGHYTYIHMTVRVYATITFMPLLRTASVN